MTWLNIQIPSFSEIQSQKQRKTTAAELEFWKEHAESLLASLDNIFDHAKATGRVELWRRGELMVLVVENDPQ